MIIIPKHFDNNDTIIHNRWVMNGDCFFHVEEALTAKPNREIESDDKVKFADWYCRNVSNDDDTRQIVIDSEHCVYKNYLDSLRDDTKSITKNQKRIKKMKKQTGGDHYSKLSIQPMEVAKAWCTQEEVNGACMVSILKYLARYKNKGGVKDLEKARDYLEELIENLSEEDE